MLIINTDDFGKNVLATDNSLDCFKKGLITSASAMVFMKNSQYAAESALETGLETGLHLNLTLPFNGKNLPCHLREKHLPIIKYLCHGKWAQIVYNPLIKKNLDFLFKAQCEEYERLYHKEPTRIDGHHHMHLCMNMVIDRIIPAGLCVRRNFSFEPGEKNAINRFYRKYVDSLIVKRYCCTDSFFEIASAQDHQRYIKLVRLANFSNVELMVHPEKKETFEYMSSTHFKKLIAGVPKGTFRMLAQSFYNESSSY